MLALFPALELDAGLFMHLLQRCRAHSVQTRLHGQRQPAECGQRLDFALDQAVALVTADPGDEAQMIVSSPPRIALLRPVADVTMARGFGIRVAQRIRRHVRFEPAPHHAVVGREIVHPETGQAVLLKVLTELGEYAVVEQMPVMEGRRMAMMVAPKPGVEIPVTPKKTAAQPKEDGAVSVPPAAM